MNAYEAHEVQDVLIDTVAAAQLLKVKPQTLRLWRVQQRGPEYQRISHSGIRYKVRDILDWKDINSV